MKNSMFRLTPLGLVLLLFISSCSEKEVVHRINGKVNNAEVGTSIQLWELTTTKASVIDSVQLDENGTFFFDVKPNEKTFYRITKGEKEGVLLLLDSTEQIDITLDAQNFSTAYAVKGSEDSERLIELGGIMNKAFESRDSLNEAYRAYYPNVDEETVLKFQNRLAEIDGQLNKRIEKYIQQNMNSLVVLATIENLDIDGHYETYKKVDDAISAAYPESPYFKAFHQKFEYSSKFTPGREVPDITMPNAKGELTSLSSLRGKVVLIDFWASWCKPCRAENPNVVKLYNKYKGQDFEIFGVSLDQQKEAWLNAIQQDGLSWVHVSDLKLWQSPVVQLYDIKGIPLTILLDKEGKIIAKNLRGEALAQKLEEIFSES